MKKEAGKITWKEWTLESDAIKTKNLSDANPDRVARMQAQLDGSLSSVVESLNGRDD